MRNRLVQTLEAAETTDDEAARRALLTYVVVGAGYAGVETIAELQDFAADVAPVLPALAAARPALHARRAARRDHAGGGGVAGGVRDDRAAAPRDRDPHRDDGRARVARRRSSSPPARSCPPARLAWTAGVKPHPSVAKLGLPLDDDGRISTGATCQVEGLPDVWAIGDAAGDPRPRAAGQPVARRPRSTRPARRRWPRDNVAARARGDAARKRALPLQDARRVRRHGPPPGGRQHGRDQVARLPRLVPRPHATTSRCHAGRQAAPPPADRLDRRAALPPRLLRARPARAPARARRRGARGGQRGRHRSAG